MLAVVTCTLGGSDASGAATAPAIHPVDPSFSPDGRWIVFSQQAPNTNPNIDAYKLRTGLWMVRSNGRALHEIHHGEDWDPFFAAGGDRIVFVTIRRRRFPFPDLLAVHSIDRRGGSARTLARGIEQPNGLSIIPSPDGRYLALSLDSASSPSGKVVVVATQTGARHVIDKVASAPAWSPHGNDLVFAACVTPPAADASCRTGLFVESADGRGIRERVGTIEASRSQLVSNLAWPGDNWITYEIAGDTGSGSQVFEVRPGGAGHRRLFSLHEGFNTLQWSPDGSRVIDWGGTEAVRGRRGRVIRRLTPAAPCSDHASDPWDCGTDAAWTRDSRRFTYSCCVDDISDAPRLHRTWLVIADRNDRMPRAITPGARR
jgi:Tol biopolymer transport system component